MNDPKQAKPTQQEVANRARLALERRSVAEQAKSNWLVIAAAVIAFGWVLYDQNATQSARAEAVVDATRCRDDDAGCIGERKLGAIQSQCSAAIESKIPYQHEWTDGALEVRFNSPAWYKPTTQLIYTGNHLLVQNAFGAKSKAQYFCVTSAATGQVINAGFPGTE